MSVSYLSQIFILHCFTDSDASHSVGLRLTLVVNNVEIILIDLLNVVTLLE